MLLDVAEQQDGQGTLSKNSSIVSATWLRDAVRLSGKMTAAVFVIGQGGHSGKVALNKIRLSVLRPQTPWRSECIVLISPLAHKCPGQMSRRESYQPHTKV